MPRPSEFNDAVLDGILARNPPHVPTPATPCRKCGDARSVAEQVSYGEQCENCFIGNRPASPAEPHRMAKLPLGRGMRES